jgi:hypothetical protein
MSCAELKSIQYKSMLLHGVPAAETKTSDSLSNLEKFLEENKTSNQAEPWNKLDKTMKTKKLLVFAETYGAKNEFTEEESILLIAFLKDCLDKKRIQRVKDVVYDKETGIITDIPALTYLKTNKHFTLKNVDKRVSTLRNLPPKKTGTAKNIVPKENEDSEEELE